MTLPTRGCDGTGEWHEPYQAKLDIYLPIPFEKQIYVTPSILDDEVQPMSNGNADKLVGLLIIFGSVAVVVIGIIYLLHVLR